MLCHCSNVTCVCSGNVVGLALRRDNALKALQAVCGPADPEEAKKTHAASLRAVFGSSRLRNAIHCSDTLDSAARELRLVFSTFPIHTFVT